MQVKNLATLARIWGFIKYYDPAVTSGRHQWDFDLFRVMPAILKAKSREMADQILVGWIERLGRIKACAPCAVLSKQNLQFPPAVKWIGDRSLLGRKLSQTLQDIYTNRSVDGQYYVSLSPAGNPVFSHEKPYVAVKFPDSGFQLLGLFRLWNIIEYWYPDRHFIGDNWGETLIEFIPRLATGMDRREYELQMMALIAKIHDTHANLWSSLSARPPVGTCVLPVSIRYVQKQPIIVGYLRGYDSASTSLRVGDVISGLNGTPIDTLVKQWTRYYGASNMAALRREIAQYMTRGQCGETRLAVRRAGVTTRVRATRVPVPPGYLSLPITNALPGPTFRLLCASVAYIKVSSIQAGLEANYIRRAKGTKGLIIDLRDYPDQFVALSLGSLLVRKKTPFARFTHGSLSTPGAFYWTAPVSLVPGNEHYNGKIVILVDAATQSQAEFTAMALRAAPRAVVVGSQTAGADGNVSKVPLPGGLFTLISGIGVYYPNGEPTQRAGITPDVVIKPTIGDIRNGRHPVLAEAVRTIIGEKASKSCLRGVRFTSDEGTGN